MKETKKAALLLSCFIFVFIGISSAGSKQLVGPKPPQAIEAPELNIREFNNGVDIIFVQAFHSPLSPSEVASYYEEFTGRMNAEEKDTHYRANLLEIELKSLGILKVYAIPTNPGISVKCIRSLQPRNCTSEYFRAFRDMANELDAYSRHDYNDICNRYGYLEYAYYGDSDQRGADGRLLTRDQKLFREYKAELDPEGSKQYDAESMIAEAQILIAQGRIDEAQKLFEEIGKIQQQDFEAQMDRLQGKDKKTVADHWDQWIKFLEELDGMIYPTAVFIDVHPSDWPEDEWLKDNIAW